MPLNHTWIPSLNDIVKCYSIMNTNMWEMILLPRYFKKYNPFKQNSSNNIN